MTQGENVNPCPRKKTKKENSQSKEGEKAKKERKRIEIAEAWDSIIFAQVIRGILTSQNKNSEQEKYKNYMHRVN